ncbi:1-deoxy-D-xylulose-5-phosphate reductoisomerase [Candidatus Micrarchaeota archaeon]|nr:1-deoxy-D-xylulose-5-phosphate reductoisomerase [Candidatus Micrarchaeota archaeon]
MERKKIAILGPGSIGKQTMEVLGQKHMRKIYELVSVSGYGDKDIKSIEKAIAEFDIKKVSFAVLEVAEQFKQLYPEVEVLYGENHLEKIINETELDYSVISVSGAVGIKATIASLEKGLITCIATKEVLVAAGPLVMELAKRMEKKFNKLQILRPIDSEHNAIWQALRAVENKNGFNLEEVRRIIITASGGSLKNWSIEDLHKATPDDVTKGHPTWSMGAKITVDSATMVNKALEVIEAHFLFGLPYEKIAILRHNQSITHGIVETIDKFHIEQKASPDMRMPIQYALTYLDRFEFNLSEPMEYSEKAGEWKSLDYNKIDYMDPERYPAFHIAMHFGMKGGLMPAIMNAANEVIVNEGFLKGKIKFTEIPKLLLGVCSYFETCFEWDIKELTLKDILDVDQKVRKHTLDVLYCNNIIDYLDEDIKFAKEHQWGAKK